MIYDMAVELGTSNTSIYVADNGVVWREPTCVAFSGEKTARNLIAVGHAAKAMLGKSPEKTIVIEPIENGVVADADAASLMLKAVFRAILPPSAFMPRINVLLLTPCGLSVDERKLFEEVCFAAGAKEVTLVERVIAAALGCDLPVLGDECCFVADLGGGTTDVAAIALGGIVAGISAEIGGAKMDDAIASAAFERFHARFGESTIETIKAEIGSLYENDTSTLTVGGQDATTHAPVSCMVTAAGVCRAVRPVYDAIADAIESVINVCPPDVAASIHKSGVVLTGGAAKILGVDAVLAKRLGLTVAVAPDAEYATIVGGGKLLRDAGLLKDILANN